VEEIEIQHVHLHGMKKPEADELHSSPVNFVGCVFTPALC